jgi:hypothetical protein
VTPRNSRRAPHPYFLSETQRKELSMDVHGFAGGGGILGIIAILIGLMGPSR